MISKPDNVFSDHKGREWPVVVSVLTCIRVKEHTGVNLARVYDDGCKLYVEIANDPLKFAHVLFFILFPEAEKRGVSFEDLAESLWGSTLDGAYGAFGAAIANFSQTSEQREAFGKMNKVMRDVQEKQGKLALSLIESDTMKAKIEREMTAAYEKAESTLGS